MKNYLNKVLVAGLVALPSLAAFAENGTGDATQENEFLTSATGQLEGLLAGATTPLITVITAGLAIWGGIALVGLAKRAFSAGKGR